MGLITISNNDNLAQIKLLVMIKLIFRRIHLLIFGTLFTSSILVISCGDDDDDNKGNNYKITVTLNNVNEADDFVSVVAVGTNISGNNNSPMWRLNDQDRPAAVQSVSLGDNDFTGGTVMYFIETINPIDYLTIGVQIINYGEDLTGTFTVEENGTIQINETINLMGDNTDFTENYSFNN